MVICMYTAPGWQGGADEPWGLFFSESLPISWKCFPSNDNLTVFPIQMQSTKADHAVKLGQGHHLYTHCSTLAINF